MPPLQRGSCLRGAVGDVPFLFSLSRESEAQLRAGDEKRLYFTQHLHLSWLGEFFWCFYLEEKYSKVENKAVMLWN